LLDDQPSGNPWRMVHRGVTRPSSAGRSWISSRRGGRSSRSHDLQISAQAIYTWRRQQLIDSGQIQGMTSSGHAELVAARKQIAQLENEMVIHRRAASSSAMWCPQKALCGDHGNRQRGPARAGRHASAQGLEVGLLRMARPGAVSAGCAACVADGADPGRSPGLPRRLRVPQDPR